MVDSKTDQIDVDRQRVSRWHTPVEIALVFVVFFLHGAWPAPDVNETGYVVKAVHFWNHDSYAHDFFCKTADAHPIYYATFGWLSKLGLSLDQMAWAGRLITWLLLAVAWRRLSITIVPRPWIAIFSAELFVLLTEQTYMAGEWIIGGVEAKGFAWALILLALQAIVTGRWNRAWLLVGAATSLHVVVGFWAAVCFGLVWIASPKERPSFVRLLPALCGFAILAAPGFFFAWRMNVDVDWQTFNTANRIQVFERLPHHMLPTGFAAGFVSRQLLLWFLFFALCLQSNQDDGNRRFRRFIGATMIISGIGFVLGWVAIVAPDWAASVLRLYWFRLSDIFVPCGVGLVGLQFLLNMNASHRATARLLMAGLVALVAYDGWNQMQHQAWLPSSWGHLTPRADKFMAYDDWRDVCRWATENTPPESVFITPRNASTFKWYTGRNEVANWKDMPQDAVSVVEWHDRIREIFAADTPTPVKPWRWSLSELGRERLQELARKYKAQYVIVELLPGVTPLPDPAYKNASYAVFQIPQ